MIGIISPFARSRAAPLACSFFMFTTNDIGVCSLRYLYTAFAKEREKEGEGVKECE